MLDTFILAHYNGTKHKGDSIMYKKMYYTLFNTITDVLALLETGNVWDAKKRLIAAQNETEELYISWNGDGADNNGE